MNYSLPETCPLMITSSLVMPIPDPPTWTRKKGFFWLLFLTHKKRKKKELKKKGQDKSTKEIRNGLKAND